MTDNYFDHGASQTFASDDIGGVHYPKVKVVYGANDTVGDLDHGYLVIAGSQVQIKRAKANIAASTTDGAVVSAVTSKKIRVISYQLMAGATATDATFNTKPGGAGTAISMLHACAINGGISCGFHPGGYFETSSGEGLTLTTGAGSTVGVQVSYVEV